MSRRLGSLALACAFVACSRAAPPTAEKPAVASPPASAIERGPDQAAQAASTTIAPGAPDECERIFSPPTGATLLCDEHVLATDAEVHWQSFATSESRADVNRRYQTLAARCHVVVVAKPPIFSVEQGLTHLSTHEASPVGYPTCTVSASPSHRTVIMISTMLKR